MAQSIDVVDHISTLLDSGNYKEALAVPKQEKYTQSFKDNCWDLISVVIGKVQDDTVLLKPSLYGTCEQLLGIIIDSSTPEEALLEFIEQIEVAKNDAQFGVILPPLQELLKKLSMKRGRSLEWCLNSITSYIENIPLAEYQLEGKERLLIDSDPNIRRVAKIYSLLPSFYCHFINELNDSEPNVKTKQIITAFLISLLGKPLIYIDLDTESHKNSEARSCCINIIQDICRLEKNVFKFLNIVEVCYRERLRKSNNNDNEDEKSPYEHREKINLTTLSGLFYVIFSGHFEVPEYALPQVYSLDYTLQTVMLCVIHLLKFTEFSIIAKAEALFEAILNRFPYNISHQLLLSPVHFDVCKGLINIAVYSSYETLRKKSVMLIGTHVNKFDYKGRCALIKYILDTANHSGMIGYAITLYKTSMYESFKNEVLDECFSGAQLSHMIKKFCFLPHGAESDLVELADQIVTTLNFLRFLTLRDTGNISGFQNCYKFIEDDYLENLRVGLNMSKAHYEAKLKEIEEGRDTLGESISINVGGNVLDQIPKDKKKDIIHSALNVFHLIEGLIARLSECINVNKMQGLTMDCSE